MNISLPIFEHAKAIVSAVNENAVTIISAETGSGKSTQVCQMLYQEGYEVVITEPRRLAARTLAERVAEELNVELGCEVGYRTAFEYEDSDDTRILFCTDGLQLVKTITEKRERANRVLIIDEVHEWNLNIETLVAWAKARVEAGWTTKVVVMSATLETDKLRDYFGKACVMSIPGRNFPVTREKCKKNELVYVIRNLISEGKNVLVFVPGKKEISDVIDELTESMLRAVVLPLHGELTPKEQKLCFEKYSLPKVVVATNVAQTSVTVPDIDAVVDTGLERRIETDRYGVEGLFLHNISKADIEQRAGRAGRTKAGEYYLCSDVGYELRDEYPLPEIQRSILDQVVLRLASVGIDATELQFFHQPSTTSLLLAKKALTHLGALSDGKITDMGRKMARIPISAKYARMIIEAEKYGVVDDVITITAILECGSLIDYRSKKVYCDFSNEEESDLLAELDVWNKLMQMSYVDFKKEGINGKTFFRVKELRNKLIDVLSGIVDFTYQNNRELVKKACIAGMVDNLYRRNFDGYIDEHYHSLRLDRKSTIYYRNPTLLIGLPLTIQFEDRWGYKGEMTIIKMASEVKAEWLYEIAPYLITQTDGDASYSPENGCYVYRTVYFNGLEIETRIVYVPDHPDALRLKAEYEEEERRRAEFYRAYSLGYEYPRYKRQEEIELEGEKFKVSYLFGNSPCIFVDEKFLKTVSVKSATLDNGTLLTIRCNGFSANNFPALADKVQKVEIKAARESIENSLGNARSAKEEVVTKWFSRLGKTFIAKTWSGEERYGFVYLALRDNMISLNFTEDEEIASSETEVAIKFLFRKAVMNRYPEKKFIVKKSSKKTKEKSPEKELFDDFVKDALDGLTVDNFSESLEMLDEFFEELMN